MNKKIFYVHTDFSKYIIKCFNLSFIEKFGHGKIFLKMLSDIKNITKGKIIIPTYNYDFGKKKFLIITMIKVKLAVFPNFLERNIKIIEI